MMAGVLPKARPKHALVIKLDGGAHWNGGRTGRKEGRMAGSEGGMERQQRIDGQEMAHTGRKDGKGRE